MCQFKRILQRRSCRSLPKPSTSSRCSPVTRSSSAIPMPSVVFREVVVPTDSTSSATNASIVSISDGPLSNCTFCLPGASDLPDSRGFRRITTTLRLRTMSVSDSPDPCGYGNNRSAKMMLAGGFLVYLLAQIFGILATAAEVEKIFAPYVIVLVREQL